MGKIRINDIRLFSNHGCLTEEGKIGSAYRVDITINVNLKKAAQTDELSDTADYVQVNRIVKEEMAVRSHLLEHVAKRILDRLLLEIPVINKARVKISKINPPIGGNVGSVSIILSKKQIKKKLTDK